jgi:hypothetical protein
VNAHQLDGLASLKGYIPSPLGSPAKPNQPGSSGSLFGGPNDSAQLQRMSTAPDITSMLSQSQTASMSDLRRAPRGGGGGGTSGTQQGQGQGNGGNSSRPSSRQQFGELRALDRAVTADQTMRRPLPTDTVRDTSALDNTRTRMRQDMGVSQSLSSLSALRSASFNATTNSATNNMSNTNNTYNSTPSHSATQVTFNEALKKSWHAVLRECHRADPQSFGQIPRADFVAAMRVADPQRKLADEGVQQLTDSFLLPNGNVNYLLCFRKYLTDLTKNSAQLSILAKSAHKTVAFQRTNSLPVPIENDMAAATAGVGAGVGNHPKIVDHVGEEHHNHPWEFNYERKAVS